MLVEDDRYSGLSALIATVERERGWVIDCTLSITPVSVRDAWCSAPDLAKPHFCLILEVLSELRLVDLNVFRSRDDKDNYWKWLLLLFKRGIKTIGLFKDLHLVREAIVRFVKDPNVLKFCRVNQYGEPTMSEELCIRWANLVVHQTEQVKQKNILTFLHL